MLAGAAVSEQICSFDALVDGRTRVLILGSIPGVASLQAVQYYAHPRNAFWAIMAELFKFPPELNYAERCDRLATQGVGLWDTLRSCERPGSLDSAIVETSIEANDFSGLLSAYPLIGAIFFNGAKSEQVFKRKVVPLMHENNPTLLGLLHLERLPSTSPANAGTPYSAKLQAWSSVSDTLQKL